MDLILIISNNCEACDRAQKTLEKILNDNPGINLTTLHKKSYTNKSVVITPALFVDGMLFSYGDIDTYKLLKKINGE
jgi:predicted thioredoxin/glutaredoxin